MALKIKKNGEKCLYNSDFVLYNQFVTILIVRKKADQKRSRLPASENRTHWPGFSRTVRRLTASRASDTRGGVSGAAPGGNAAPDELDGVYEKIKNKISEGGYAESILLEKQRGYINFKFKDNLLFYPDSAAMRESSFDILQYMGDLLRGVDSEIDSIEISGFTAEAGKVSSGNYFAWELSSNRAISVLKFFSSKCSLPQSKMFIAGHSYYQPVAGNDTEKGRSLNRRVEVKIVRSKPASSGVGTGSG